MVVAVPNAIYVNGVPHDASEADVRAAFERFGEIKMVNARHISTGVSWMHSFSSVK